MSTTQVRITIPTKLKDLAKNNASEYGLSLAGYIKNLIIQEVKQVYPIKHPSDSTLKAINQGNQEFLKKQTKNLSKNNLDDFLSSL